MRTDREKQGFRGSVSRVDVETARFEDKDGLVEEKPSFSHTITFNQEGWLSEQINRNPDGSEWRTVSDYSDSCKLLATRTYDPSDTLNSEVKYIYDDEGKLVREQSITQDGKANTTTIYTYDSDGGKTKIQEFSDKTNALIGIEGTGTSISAGGVKRIETRYDDRGDAVELRIFNTAGSLVSRVEITRDVRGNSLEEAQYVGDVPPLNPPSSDSCSTGEMAALTDEEKAEVAAEVERLFSPGTAMLKNTHRYDAEGKLIESTLMMMGMYAGRQTFAYDEAGNKTEEVSYKEDGTLESKAIFTRDYDEHGNWTTELVSTASSWDAEFELSKPVHVTRRTITYYT